jgi:wobble nucleotide-excising tRNase
MTIKKLISIENVGRLSKCIQRGPELSRYNLFFAENGRGKTTLCAVLRSLETGQSEHITERKTLSPKAGLPTAVVRLEAGEAKYQNQVWNRIAPEITIFDSTFVAQNVHAGEYVDRDHRSNLLQVIIGKDGIQLAKQVNDLDATIREKSGEITRSRRSVETHVPKGVKLEAFLALKEDTTLDEKIALVEKQLATAKEAEAINKRAHLTLVTIPSLPVNIKTVLAKTLDAVSIEAERRLKEQLARHDMQENGETWLSSGLSHLNDDECPFCGQNISTNDLVAAYRKYFSDAYAALIAEIDAVTKELELLLGDASIRTASHAVSMNNADIEFWSKHISIKTNPIDPDSEIVKPATALRMVASKLLADKQSRPLQPIQLSEAFTLADTKWQNHTKVISQSNEDLQIANLAITEKKAEAAKANIVEIEKTLSNLNCIKLRYSERVKPPLR